jgi:hypothetical protein
MAIRWNTKATARSEREALADELEHGRGIGGKNTDVIGRRRVEEVENGTARCGNMFIRAGGAE